MRELTILSEPARLACEDVTAQSVRELDSAALTSSGLLSSSSLALAVLALLAFALAAALALRGTDVLARAVLGKPLLVGIDVLLIVTETAIFSSLATTSLCELKADWWRLALTAASRSSSLT